MFDDFISKAADAIGKGAEALKEGSDAIKKAQEDANTVSEDSPFEVNGLEVYPTRLKYKNIRCNFNDIEHIGWHWQSETYNAVLNKQKVELTLYIKNEKPISISKSTMYVTPKLVKAYNYIANKTFENRLKFYTDQLEQTGSFIYTSSGFWGESTTTFYTDGRVLSGDKTFELSKAKIEAFELTIKEGGLFSSKLSVKLDIDRDVFLALINYILENPQSPSEYIQNYKKQKEARKTANQFLSNTLSLMAILSYADGFVSSEEIAVVEDFLLKTMNISQQELPNLIAIFNQVKNSPNPFEHYATSLVQNYDNDILGAILDVLFLIAIADGHISAEEELLLLEAESIFGLKSSMYNEFKAHHHKQKKNKKEYYLEVLGLSVDASREEISKTYKRLAMKFHPDRVSHLGEEFSQEAEIKMKEINEAYEYLKNKQ